MEIGIIILMALVAIGLFFLCRQLNCWYLKINERIEIMYKMIKNQEKMINLLNEVLETFKHEQPAN